ncbi:MAG: hypothetical protein ACXABG_05765, partial [Promethearchaeota archaeon]
YNVTSFNTSKALEWRELDWFAPPRGFVNTTPGGQILINFTGFYEKDPNDFFNLFESPIPYMNIEFKKIHQGSLITNRTFYNLSNGEVDMNLLLGYNYFKSGFLIPNDNFTYLKQQAYAQDQSPFMNATVIIEETQNRISFDFRQKVGFLQKTKSTYDKITGLLTYTNTSVGNYTLEMTLTNLPGVPINHTFIPSYMPILMLFTLGISSILLILKLKKSVKTK